jgi:hypothetical protein
MVVESKNKHCYLLFSYFTMQSQESDEEEDTNKFDKHVSKLKQIMKIARGKEEEAGRLRKEAEEMEFQMLTQSLMSPVDPSQEEMDRTELLHQKAQHLVRRNCQHRSEK